MNAILSRVRVLNPANYARAGGQIFPLTLSKNFLWTFLGNGAYGACQWTVIVILTKLCSPEMVGQYALGLAISAPIFMFANLNLRVVQATDTRQEYRFNHYLGLRLLTTPLAVLAVATVVLASGYPQEAALVILAVAAVKALEALSDTAYGALQQQEQMDRIGISLVIKSVLCIAALIAAISLTQQVFWGIAGLALAVALTLIWYDAANCAWVLNAFPRSRSESSLGMADSGASPFRPSWEKAALLRLIRLALPLGFVWMLISLTFSVPRYFIEHFLGTRELGIFAALFQLMLTGSIVVMAICQSAQPRLAHYFAAGNISAFRRLLLKIVSMAGLLGGVGVLLATLGGREILTLLYRPEYAEHADCFKWVMVAAVFYYLTSSLGYGLTATRAFDKFLLPYLVAVVMASACSFILIPSYGLLGAAWTLCAVNLAISVMLTIILIIVGGKKCECV